MNKWDEIQTRIKTKYPNFTSLPFLIRLRLKLFETPSTRVECFSEETGEYSQTYKIFTYKNQDYFWKFGW